MVRVRITAAVCLMFVLCIDFTCVLCCFKLWRVVSCRPMFCYRLVLEMLLRYVVFSFWLRCGVALSLVIHFEIFNDVVLLCCVVRCFAELNDVLCCVLCVELCCARLSSLLPCVVC